MILYTQHTECQVPNAERPNPPSSILQFRNPWSLLSLKPLLGLHAHGNGRRKLSSNEMMKGVLISFICALGLIGIVGCTGDNSTSPFEGSYQGTFSATNNANDNGTAHITVDANGNVFGTVTENGTGGSAEVRGIL